MKKSDIYICGFMYAFSFFFLYLTQSFPLGARHYPHFVIGLLLLLTTVRVGQMVRDYRREKTSENDMPVLFDGFMPKPPLLRCCNRRYRLYGTRDAEEAA